MSEEKLCWECREYIISKYGSSAYFPPFQHCHHEPKEKTKCWCDNNKIKPLGIYTVVERIGKNLEDMLCPLIFCPQCGKKL